MAVLDPTAIALLVKMCAPPNFSARLIDALAQVETGRNTSLPPNINRNGTTDNGLMRINSSNFGWLNLTPKTAADPCNSVAASAKYLIHVAGGSEPFTDANVERLVQAIRVYNPGDPKYESKFDQALVRVPRLEEKAPIESAPSSIEDGPSSDEINFQ